MPTRTAPASARPTEAEGLYTRPQDVREVHARVVPCDGGGGALGHPRVFLHMQGAERRVECPYCSRLFVLVGDGGGHGH